MPLSNKEIQQMLLLKDEEADELRAKAHVLRLETLGEKTVKRAIIEFSNHCRCTCQYCGLRGPNKILKRYRMSVQEILQSAREAINKGFNTVILQSGEDLYYTSRMLSEIIRGIKSLADIEITLSLGERSFDEYAEWKEAGADKVLIKHETSDAELYEKLHFGASLKKRVGLLKELGKLGYLKGGGFMIGLPGQTTETLANDILLLDEIGCDMAGMGPFLPAKDTPLEAEPAGNANLCLNTIAICRLLRKDMHIPVATSLRQLMGDGGVAGLSSGANVLMDKAEPRKYRELYRIY